MADGNSVRKSTNQFMRQGHTANEYGNDPNVDAKGKAGKPPRDIKP